MNINSITYLSGDLLRLSFLSLSNLTNLTPPCKLNRLRENNLTFNHKQFQDTRVYIQTPMRLVKAFPTLLSSCDCTLPWYWSNSKRTFKVYIITHTYRGLFRVITWLRVGYIWGSRLTRTLELVPKNSLFEILWQIYHPKLVTSFTNCVTTIVMRY
jgi:hypothetical protein